VVESKTGRPLLPVAGIRILDLGTMTPGKYCTFLLGDPGAEVIRVERPTAGKMKQVGTPLKFSETPGHIRSQAPSIGQDSESILQQLGYNEEAIETLRCAHAI